MGQLGHVIQICDLDGAFAPDDSVRENPSAEETLYSTTDIVTTNRDALIADRTTKRNGVGSCSNSTDSGRSRAVAPS